MNDQILAILRAKLDPTTLAIIETALADADRMAIIRDTFLAGRDIEAVQMIRDLDPNAGFRQIMGMGSDILIEPNMQAQLTSRPQLPFRPTHVVVSRETAPRFMINDIRAGLRSQFVQAGDVPADIFAVDLPVFEQLPQPDADGRTPCLTLKLVTTKRLEELGLIAIDMPELLPGQELVFVVQNISLALAAFHGAILGRIRAL